MNSAPHAAKQILSIADVVMLTGFCKQTVINRFENEKGVLILERPETMHKRKYRSIRIPRAVFERVLKSMTV